MNVSVVIPVRNQEALLPEAIGSVLAQPEVAQLIVVDDGSSDRSAEVARALGAEVLSQPASGVPSALNLGISNCREEILAFLDSDDLWPLRRLESSLDILRRHPRVAGVFGTQQVFMHPNFQQRGPAEMAYLRGCLVLRKSSWNEVGPFRGDINYGDFLDWYSRARDLGFDFQAIEDVVLWRRSHANNMTRGGQGAQDYLKVVHGILQRRRQQQKL